MLRNITRNGEQRIGSLRTDNGSEFKSEFIKSYLGDNVMKQVFGTAYTPQSNGQVEKWNGILKRLIYMNLHKNQKYDWVEDLQRLVGNYNDAWQSAIKPSPKLAERSAFEDVPPPGQSDTNMGGEFELNSKAGAHVAEYQEEQRGRGGQWHCDVHGGRPRENCHSRHQALEAAGRCPAEQRVSVQQGAAATPFGPFPRKADDESHFVTLW
jgi:transposase InsO family protein